MKGSNCQLTNGPLNWYRKSQMLSINLFHTSLDCSNILQQLTLLSFLIRKYQQQQRTLHDSSSTQNREKPPKSCHNYSTNCGKYKKQLFNLLNRKKATTEQQTSTFEMYPLSAIQPPRRSHRLQAMHLL